MSRESVASRIAAKCSDDELVTCIRLDHSLVDATFRSFRVLEDVYQLGVGPTPVEVWPRFTKIDTSTE
jgi:hypothetical protein